MSSQVQSSDPLHKLPLPRHWSRHAKSSLLHAVSLARVALIDVWSGFENGPLVYARQAARIARLEARVALFEEELRIKDARLARIPPHKRPHYPPCERFAILSLRAAAGWSATQTARRFLLTAATIASWARRLDEAGHDALVQTRAPVNRFPDYVRELVRSLRSALPGMGRRRVAAVLARAGLHLAPTTVRRLMQWTGGPPPTPTPTPSSADSRAKSESTSPTTRVVTARYPHHVWHVDLTIVPTTLGFWVPWLPFSLSLRWPFCCWVAAVLDHSSRAVVERLVTEKEPSADDVCALLDRAVEKSGRPPRHIISDRGAQFQSQYLAWCRRTGARPRFGAVGRSGSIAIIERFFRSLKDEYLRRIIVPFALPEMRAELDAYMRWYNEHRPHSALGGATPKELLDATTPASSQPGVETRPLYPLARGTSLPRRRVGKLEAVVTRIHDRPHLPIVQLRNAA